MSDTPPPGRFENCDSLVIAELLEEYALTDQPDSFGDTEEYGNWVAYLPNIDVPNHPEIENLRYAYNIQIDSRGFFYYKGYDTNEEARQEYDLWEKDWMEWLNDGSIEE